ncbi:MAG: hypothetical protein M1831_002500 [Alyxoria varia]|nr:MAG: hypothetical protein M1831_002500 [Alyxoria varia]
MSSTAATPQAHAQTTYLLTGASRGLGLSLSRLILSRPDTLLLALVRNPSSTPDLDTLVSPTSSIAVPVKSVTPTSEKPAGAADSAPATTAKSSLLRDSAKNITLIKLPYDASIPTSAQTALSTLQSNYNIGKLNVVIANAGVITYFGPTTHAPAERFTREYQINALAPLQLFTACLPLLRAANQFNAEGNSTTTNTAAVGNSNSKDKEKEKEKEKENTRPPTPPTTPHAKFFAISSLISSTSQIPHNPHVSAPTYGASKAALNHLVVKLHTEHPDLIVGLLTPGRTRTGFGGEALREVVERMKALGMEMPEMPGLAYREPEESARGLLGRVERASREGDGGRLWDWCDGEVEW